MKEAFSQMTLIVCDLDGTVADDRARKLNAGPEPLRSDKTAYLRWLDAIQSEETLAADAPVPGMSVLLRGLASQLTLIVYLTAREERYRDVTKDWLRRHGFPPSTILMRPNGSWLSSRDLKRFHICELQDIYRDVPILSIDDDGSGDCGDMYAELLIPHLHMKLPPLRGSNLEERALSRGEKK